MPAGSKGQLIRLAKSWGSKKLAKNAEKIAATLLDIAGDDDQQENLRIDAAEQLIGLMSEDADTATELLETITPRTAQTTAVGIINSLQDSRAENVGDVLLDADGSIHSGNPCGWTPRHAGSAGNNQDTVDGSRPTREFPAKN